MYYVNLSGKSLTQFLQGNVGELIDHRQNVPFKLEEILKIAVQVLHGLCVLHSRRVLHR